MLISGYLGSGSQFNFQNRLRDVNVPAGFSETV